MTQAILRVASFFWIGQVILGLFYFLTGHPLTSLLYLAGAFLWIMSCWNVRKEGNIFLWGLWKRKSKTASPAAKSAGGNSSTWQELLDN